MTLARPAAGRRVPGQGEALGKAALLSARPTAEDQGFSRRAPAPLNCGASSKAPGLREAGWLQVSGCSESRETAE